MTDQSSVSKKLDFKYLPAFAEYLLKNRLEDFIRVQLKLAIDMEAHDLKAEELNKYAEDQLVQMSVPSYTAFLESAVNNDLDSQIEDSIQKWVNNQLPSIPKDELVVNDLTLSSYFRKNGFYEFISDYTKDIQLAVKLVKEIEDYSLSAQSRAFLTYIRIREEKMNEINLIIKKNKAKLLEAQEIANIGSFEWNFIDSKASEYTPQVYKIFEMEKFPGLGDFMNFVHPDDKPKLKTAIDKATSGEGNYECEYRYIINGKQKVIWSRGILENKDGKPVSLKGTIMDITDRYSFMQDLARLNNSLDHKNRELKRSNDELMSFSYAASHDLQEPLRKIKTFSNILLDKENKNLSEDGKLYLSKIDSSTQRMQTLIHDLLAFSRTQTNLDSKQKVDLNSVIANIRTSYEEMIAEKKVRITSAQLSEIFAVPFQIQQLFENVISNSVKYRKPEGILTVDISFETVTHMNPKMPEEELKYYKISVKDNGIGFDNQYSEKIFEIFHRLHGKGEYSGTGIGLAICKRIVENHDGFIKASGKVGEGASFEIYFPVATF